jgi:4-hydroxy-2-oxoheptanedioate aldolase
MLERLRAGATLAGMQCFSASPVMIEAMGQGGLDFTIVDMEHCPTSLETLAHCVRAADASGIVPLARVPQLDRQLIGRALDLGVRGIVLPHASPDRCAAAVRSCRYAPEGERGACPVVRAAGYLPADWSAHADRTNREVLVVPLVEDPEAVEAIDSIFAIDGIDIVFLGPFDLSISMGLKGADYRHPKLAEILDRVVAAANKRGKYVMTTVGATIEHEYAAALVARGVRLLSFSADVAVFLTACRRIAALRDS